MSDLHPIDAVILGRLYDRPNWAKSLYRVKGRLTALVNAGLVERIAPPGNTLSAGRGRNMVMLAAAVSSFTPEQITRHDQGRKVGYYRKAIIMAMHRRFPDLKLKNLSGSIGRNCHTTAVHALKTGRELMAFNPEFAALVARLEKVASLPHAS